MKFLKKFVLTIILLFVFFPVSAENNVAYLDITLMMSKSLAGQSIQKQLEKKHKKNIEVFKQTEEEFKQKEEKILSKKNVLSKEDYEKEISKLRTEVKDFRIKIQEIDWDIYKDKKVLIKGCTSVPVPIWSYLIITARLSHKAKQIYFGEPCAAVDIYKNSTD